MSGKRYELGGRWSIQVGEIEFEKGSGSDALFFLCSKTDQSDDYQFNIPARLISALQAALTQLLIDSGIISG